MVILKLVAWSDRPEERAHDLMDILKIIERYFEHAYDEITEFHFDTFLQDSEEEFDQLKIAAEVLGRKAREYLNQSLTLSERINHVIGTNLVQSEHSPIARRWASERGWELNYALDIMGAFQKGLHII